MNNYAETKKELDRIREAYGCKGEMIFRTALQCVVQYGTDNLSDDWNYAHSLEDINNRHDAAEAEGKILLMSRDFEIAILECAREIAKASIYDLLVYVQKEVWLSNDGGMDYKRAIELLKGCMYDIEQRENCEDKLTLYAFEDIGFDDEELVNLNFGYLFNARKEEE